MANVDTSKTADVVRHGGLVAQVMRMARVATRAVGLTVAYQLWLLLQAGLVSREALWESVVDRACQGVGITNVNCATPKVGENFRTAGVQRLTNLGLGTR